MSVWARRACTAGPLEALSIRLWRYVGDSPPVADSTAAGDGSVLPHLSQVAVGLFVTPKTRWRGGGEGCPSLGSHSLFAKCGPSHTTPVMAHTLPGGGCLAASAAFPISPPRASTSCTSWLFADPPMADPAALLGRTGGGGGGQGREVQTIPAITGAQF